MEKNNQIFLKSVIGGAVLILLIWLIFTFWNRSHQVITPAPVVPPTVQARPCPGETKTMEQTDVYMKGLIEKGEKFNVVLNYYDCNTPKKGEIVLHAFSNSMDPVVKRIVAVEGDHFSFMKDKKRKAWNLKVNDKIVRSVIRDHEPYFFGTDEAPTPLHLAMKSRHGVISHGEVILFSSWPPGDKDGGQFGLTSTVDLIGKVEVETK